MNVGERVLNDFTSYSSTADIALKHHLHKEDVKLILRNSLSMADYLNISRIIGGRTVAKKMKSSAYRRQYVMKMSSSVSSSIHSSMTDSKYLAAWKKKAKQGSVKGNCKIRRLLIQDGFYGKWKDKCSKGGRVTKNLELGIFDPALSDQRRKWSAKGISKSGRKWAGPKGEHMYNYMEALVAKILISKKLDYIYEKRILTSHLNGFFSIDFVVPKQLLIIEVTYWDKISEKCASLEAKFNHLRKKFPGYRFILVTKPSKQDRYKSLLQDYIYVLTPSELKIFVAEVSKPLKRGNKFHNK